jgi:acetyl-CoA carboxylase carboxyl transferase subunit beta
MNWLTNFVRPKIRSLMKKSDVPEHFWKKCPNCDHMIFHKELFENLFVCYHCQYHFRFPILERIKNLYDDYDFKRIPDVIFDPLKFKDTKRYSDRLKEYRQKTNQKDSIFICEGSIGPINAVTLAFDFNFMGGSMGICAGESFIKACRLAIETSSPFIAICASGGARMQEGILSLMQMPKTTVGVLMLKEAQIPYITLLTDPTTGGVTASFAMLGDIAIAEPGAMIGFAGARVIEETIRQKLPDGFQKAEYLLKHGMIDKVVHRHKIKETLIRLLSHLTRKSFDLTSDENTMEENS